MRLRASFTVENAWIIPIFTLIIAALISLCLYMHDAIILENAVLIADMKIDQEIGAKQGEAGNESGFVQAREKTTEDEVLSNAKAYIAQNAAVTDTRKYSAQYLQNVIKSGGRIANNDQPDFIRTVNAGKKLFGTK